MPRTRNEALVEKARVLASLGKTQREVAAELGIAYRTLQSWRDIEWPMGRPRVADGEASARTRRRRRQGGNDEADGSVGLAKFSSVPA